MTAAGRTPQNEKRKIRVNVTLDPDLITAIKKLEGKRANVSGFLEDAGREKLKRAMRLGPKLGPDARKMGKK